MNALSNLPRILLVDSNVYFAKRVGDALQQLGFEVVPCTQAAYALTICARWARSKWLRFCAPIPRPRTFRSSQSVAETEIRPCSKRIARDAMTLSIVAAHPPTLPRTYAVFW